MPTPLGRAFRPADALPAADDGRAMVFLYRLAAACLALAVFMIDTFTTLEGAVAVLYVAVVLLAARTGRRLDILIACAVSTVLTLCAYLSSHGMNHVGAPTVRGMVSLAAVGITAMLALQNQSATRRLAAQARLLDLSHDMIFVRSNEGMIQFWNRAAEDTYGFSAKEAIGRLADELLRTVYPVPRDVIEDSLRQAGRWDGTLEQQTKTGAVLTLTSRWVVQRDHAGRAVGVMETHTDITDRKATYAALVKSERRYRRMFDASRIGVVQEDWRAVIAELRALGLPTGCRLRAYLATRPEVVRQLRRLASSQDANPAFLAMIGKDDLSMTQTSVDDLLPQDDTSYIDALAAYCDGLSFYEGETEVMRSDGTAVPVLFTITFPRADDDGCALIFTVDNTERLQAQHALLLAQTELAHAARVSTLGELTGSIAHEVNQPLMAIATNGEAGLRWLRRNPRDLAEVEASMTQVVEEARRASDIVRRMHAFLRKAPPQYEMQSAAAVIDEASRLVHHELARGEVELKLDVADDLPLLWGDRVQLQQVLVNLMVNASQAMAGQSTSRLLTVRARRHGVASVLIAVSDTGPGIAQEDMEQLFEPFFTTKTHGMGMGLAICRSMAQAHGGELTVQSVAGEGSSFELLLSGKRAQ